MFEQFLARSGLSIERLHTLLLLRERGSLIKAANGDPIRQSRMSHHLRELSAFMGTALTQREGRSIRLTPAGEELVELAEVQFQSLFEFQSRVSGKLQRVRIGAGDSLLQWLLIPALGIMRKLGNKQAVDVENLRTIDIVRGLQEQRIEFGILRKNAVPKDLSSCDLGVVSHVIVVPRKLAGPRMDLRSALLECPHATIAGDGELVQRLRTLASNSGGSFQPELVCDNIGQCIAAVKTGDYAAVLPTQSWEQIFELDCKTINDQALSELDRAIVLAWSPRNLEALGEAILKFKGKLLTALQEEANRIGLVRD